MTSAGESAELTRIGAGTPMGELMRQFWIPALKSSELEVDGAPVRLMLLGERLIPIGTVYDPLVARGLDALNYACYQDARFLIAGTPSGITLAPEGGAHQSIGSQLIGISQDGLAAFEPAYLDELAVILD